MYNDSYHPVDEATLNWMLASESAQNMEVIKARVEQAKAAQERSYVIELPDGGNYVITNGIVQGSKHVYNE
jgi:hypothetical protein